MLRRISFLLASSIALEVAAYPKPGNVHRLRNFSDTLFEDFLITAVIAEHYLFKAVLRGCRLARGFKLRNLIGDLIEATVAESRTVSGGGNTCLGSALLLFPLAIAAGYVVCKKGALTIDAITLEARRIVETYSTISDSIHLYNAIRIASPSYIRKGEVIEGPPDVWDERFRERLIEGGYTLWKILVYSSRTDLNCREIVESYPRSVRNAKFLQQRLRMHGDWNLAIIETYLYQLAQDIDTLIVRKHGFGVAEEVSRKAAKILDTCLTNTSGCLSLVKDFDDELAKKGINPGSSADIIVSTIALHSIKKWSSILRP
jgi:triphosphoribosyl-dephospho-CoA synthase